MEVFAQVIGIIAMMMNVSIFSMKNQKTMIFIQFLASILFSVNMLLLGALSGGLMNIAGVVRGIVFVNKKRLGKMKWFFTAGLFALYIVFYILGFAVFGKEVSPANVIIEFLPVFAMIVMTIGFAVEGAGKTRLYGLVNSPPWLIYNSINFNIGGIICEIFCILSIVWGIFRHDIKKEKK